MQQVDTDRGAVAAGHAETARIGAEVLESGGNAADAVVAMCFASTVAEGTLTSLGGGGFILVAAPDRSPRLLDAFVRQPGMEVRPLLAAWESFTLPLDGTVLRFGTGPASVAVPGLPAGLVHTARRYGRLPLPELAAPAAELASSGLTLTATQAGEHESLIELLTRDAEGEIVYRTRPGGPARAAGELFRQPLLAAAIEEIAATAGESFYRGAIAQRLADWSHSRGGRLSATDLAAYRVIERDPLELRIGDVTVHTNPAPAMGGRIIERLLPVMCLATDPLGSDRDRVVATALAEVISELRPPVTSPPEDGEAVLHGVGPEVGFSSSPNTTHVSAVDAAGMVASATTTLGFGAGEYVPGTGIQLNNMLAEYDHRRIRQPGATVESMMSPTLLVSPRSTVAIGSAGSERIPQAISQVLQRMWGGMPLVDAVRSPRFFHDGSTLHAEPGFDDELLDVLAVEQALVRWPDEHAFFGTCNGVAIRDGSVAAMGDPRREAVGLVVRSR